MKKLLLVLSAVLALTAAHGQTNVYHPFPDSNATWFSWKSYCPCPPYVGIQLEIWDWLTGDTVIGTSTYKKIQEYTICQNDGSSTLGYAGAYRQDTAQKKIFLRLPLAAADTLLYDFNLSVGDTIPQNWYINYGTYPSNIISSIDSVLIGTNYRKRFNFIMSAHMPDTIISIIEGIGSTTGLLLPLGASVEYSTSLYCFTQNGQNLFINPNGFCLSNPLTVFEQEKNPSLTIFPNPFSTQTVLQTDIPLHNATLTVYNCCGQQVKQIKNISGQTVTFSRGNLASGLYFVRLTEENKIIAADKLVVSDESNH